MTQKVAPAQPVSETTEEEKKQALRNISKSRASLLLDRPFYGALALRMPLIGDHPQIGAMAVDGKNMYYNSKWVNELPTKELTGVIAHELLHVVYLHMFRTGDRDQKLWNVATDFAINRDLLDEGFQLPEKGCIDREGKYRGMTAEAIYEKLKQDPDYDNCRMPEWGTFEMDVDGDGSPVSEQDIELMKGKLLGDIAGAANVAKQAGKMPGALEEYIKQLFRPKVNWRAVLWPFLTDTVEDDFSWNRPHRGYIGEGEYFPAMKSEGIDTIVFAVDTSGSMSNKEITQAWSEIVAAAEQCRPENLVVIQADYDVQSIETVDSHNAREYKFTAKGRGGTRITPAIEAALEEFPDTAALVYLSDMGIFWNSEKTDPPPFPVLWISTVQDYEKPPFGQTVTMELD